MQMAPVPASVLGCLLIHGYGGSPFEMEGLAAALEGAGHAVRSVCLPGHGEGFENFRDYRFSHWLGHAEKEFAVLSHAHARVLVVGFSMGGAIALNLACRYPVAGVVTLSTPVFVLNFWPWPLACLRLYAKTCLAGARRLLGIRTVKKSAAGETSRDIAPWKGYDGPLHMGQIYSMREGCAATRALLPGLAAPLLVMHDARDRLVNPDNAWQILRRVSSADTTLILTRIRENVSRHHMIPTHRETASLVEEAVVRFSLEKTLDRAIQA